MHENVLQSIGNRGQLPIQQNYNNSGSFFLDELYPRKNSAVVQPMPIHPQTHQLNTPEKENQLKKNSCMSPVLPGTGSITHNITSMLSQSTPAGKQHDFRYHGIPAGYELSGYYNKEQPGQSVVPTSRNVNPEDESIIDVESDKEHLRTGDLPNITDSSISTQDSTSPQSSLSSNSNNSSPVSGCEPVTSPDAAAESQPTKKKARTNYSPEQIQALLKIFHENPYPDSEMMETIGKDLGVPENKIKIWFQNKRARWRRRVNDNMNNYVQPYVPVSPMISPVGPYGFMPANPMMRTSPPGGIPAGFPGYFNMQWMQSPGSPNGNQALLNNHYGRYPATSQQAPMPPQQYSPTSYPVSTASQYPMRTSPQQMITSQANRTLNYPQFLYPSSQTSLQNLQ